MQQVQLSSYKQSLLKWAATQNYKFTDTTLCAYSECKTFSLIIPLNGVPYVADLILGVAVEFTAGQYKERLTAQRHAKAYFNHAVAMSKAALTAA